MLLRSLPLILAMLLAACTRPPRAGARVELPDTLIVAAGERIHAGTRVVLWSDTGGYDAYRPHRHFSPDEAAPSGAPDRIARYGSWRRGLSPELAERVRSRGWTLPELAETVHQVVIHFDACGTSQECFRILHDVRGLSCHFLLDADGTVYQTLDLAERAWHAGNANDGSIGIEIAHPGAAADEGAFASWYRDDPDDPNGARYVVPEEKRGRLPAHFAGRLARPGLFRGRINGRDVVQREFTEAQYAALESLLLTLSRTFPRIRAAVPRDADGAVSPDVLPEREGLDFEGLIGHHHVSEVKIDPGPAFDWERVLTFLRSRGIPGPRDT